MANESTETTDTTTTGAGGAAAKSAETTAAKPEGRGGGEAAKPEGKPAAEAAKPSTEGGGKGGERETGRRAKDTDDDDDDVTPDDKGMVSLPYRKFMDRVGRMSKKNLRDIFGTDDVEKIKADKALFEQLKKNKSDADTAALTETEKHKKEAERLAGELEKQKAGFEKERARDAVKVFDREVTSFSKSLFNSDMYDIALDKLARAAKKGSVTTPKQATRFLEALAKEKPGWCKGASTAEETTTEEEKPKKKIPISNGASGAKPATVKSGGAAPAKTAKPGGGMTRAEVEKETGYKLS